MQIVSLGFVHTVMKSRNYETRLFFVLLNYYRTPTSDSQKH